MDPKPSRPFYDCVTESQLTKNWITERRITEWRTTEGCKNWRANNWKKKLQNGENHPTGNNKMAKIMECELQLYRTQGAEGSQPAMKIWRNEVLNKMCKIKDVNVRMNVMYNKCELYYYVL